MSEVAIKYLMNLEMPDIVMEAAGFQVKFTDITLSSITYPALSGFFQDDNSMSITMDNLTLEFTLAFHVQQVFYPYI